MSHAFAIGGLMMGNKIYRNDDSLFFCFFGKAMPLLYVVLANILSVQVAEAALTTAKNELKIAVVQEWSNFNPVTNQLASNEALLPFVVRNAISREANGKVVPDVAEAIPKLEDKKALWILKKEAKWADGKPLTCADWQLGWQAGKNPNVTTTNRSYYEKIVDITWQEETPKSCLVTYKTNDWTYDRDLPFFLPAHLDQKKFEKLKEQPQAYERNSLYVSAPTTMGLYNGPYYISEFVLGSYVVLARNEHFWGTKPMIAKIIIRHVGEANTLKAHLLSKQIDVISAVGFPADTALNLDLEFAKEKSPFKVHFQNSSIFQGVFFNLENEILKDIRVREALSRAVSKETISKSFFKSKLMPAEGILPPQHSAFVAWPSSYSKSRARNLLQSAGWKVGTDGIREKDGKRLSLVFKTSAGIKVLETIQVYICSQYKSIGVECVIKNEPPRVLLGTSVPHGDFDLTMYGQPILPDSTISSYYSSQAVPTAANSWSGGNSIRVKSAELDQLLFQFDNEGSKTLRDAIIAKVNLYIRNNFLLIPLYHRREAMVMPAQLAGIEDSFTGTDFYNPEAWRWSM